MVVEKAMLGDMLQNNLLMSDDAFDMCIRNAASMQIDRIRVRLSAIRPVPLRQPTAGLARELWGLKLSDKSAGPAPTAAVAEILLQGNSADSDDEDPLDF